MGEMVVMRFKWRGSPMLLRQLKHCPEVQVSAGILVQTTFILMRISNEDAQKRMMTTTTVIVMMTAMMMTLTVRI